MGDDTEQYFLAEEGDRYVLYDTAGDEDQEIVNLSRYAASEIYVALHSLLLHLSPYELLDAPLRLRTEGKLDGLECPACGELAGEASFSTAPGQMVCANGDCYVVTWNEHRVDRRNSADDQTAEV